ncbi:Uncharacterized protein CLAVI_000225 [Candidatus Clavichlamydia salmonicola]|uniref:hypothetical protein n=1 Tax=Candidatus Clavichlamydia salmonicola TaxID=469812 RepID=UPI0018914113|nr:hypothetical protein [Candidatus Clavichlamydia salmonicola]MBF5050613.1 Uncharacterized protein [Candidatus Clavichlamydia salmonicola]
MNHANFFSFSDQGPLEQDAIQDLKKLNREGLFPGPQEPNFRFIERVLQANDQNYKIPQCLKEIFDVEPFWVSCCFSNEGLGAWEGACTWTGERVLVQMRKKFEKKSKIYWIYKKEELLAHELVHAVRATFKEEIFEEMLAYQTSKSAFRRLLGPLFRSSKEADFFIFMTVISAGTVIFSPFLGMLCACSFLGFFIGRLTLARSYFFRASNRIRGMIGLNPLWIMIRLSDAEIKMFANQAESVLWRYINKKCKTDLRWRMLKQSYF